MEHSVNPTSRTQTSGGCADLEPTALHDLAQDIVTRRPIR